MDKDINVKFFLELNNLADLLLNSLHHGDGQNPSEQQPDRTYREAKQLNKRPISVVNLQPSEQLHYSPLGRTSWKPEQQH
ncbi:hypothetical protein Leryth_010386 [Lithospermum erythrorhizon]|nr:hypothetical protein Leryth_010386 [Lithospermum erythrorhizon]